MLWCCYNHFRSNERGDHMEREYVARNGKQLAWCLKILYLEGVTRSETNVFESERGKLNYRVLYEAEKETIDKIENMLTVFTS